MTEMIAQRDAFGETLVELGKHDPMIVVLDADLATSTKADIFAEMFPDRFFQMGVAEQNMYGVAAGLSTLGFIPFTTTFACFASCRALDQLRVTIAQPELNVKMVGAYSGILTGKTGKTHQALEDIAVFRAIPHVVTIAPIDGKEVKLAMKAMVEYHGPVYLRLTRDPCKIIMDDDYEFVIGRTVQLREGADIALIGTGQMSQSCLEAADRLAGEKIHAAVIHVPTLKPLHEDQIVNVASKTGRVLTAEDHSIIGGLGSAVAEILAEHCPTPQRRVGWQDVFAESGPNDKLLEKYGLTSSHIVQAARELME